MNNCPHRWEDTSIELKLAKTAKTKINKKTNWFLD